MTSTDTLRRAAEDARCVLIAIDTMSRNNRDQMIAETLDAIDAALAASEVGVMERKYSLAEIDRMRASLRYRAVPMFETSPGQWMSAPYSDKDVADTVERQLRTHMLNGTDPSELDPPASAR